MKRCYKCGETKPLEDGFDRKRQNKDGHLGICKVCRSVERSEGRALRKTVDKFGVAADEAISRAKTRASKLGVPFALAKQTLLQMMRTARKCPVLDIDLQFFEGPRGTSPSIDRIFPELGYVPGNIRITSNRGNVLRSNATPEESVLVAIDNLRVNGMTEVAAALRALHARFFSSPSLSLVA